MNDARINDLQRHPVVAHWGIHRTGRCMAGSEIGVRESWSLTQQPRGSRPPSPPAGVMRHKRIALRQDPPGRTAGRDPQPTESSKTMTNNNVMSGEESDGKQAEATQRPMRDVFQVLTLGLVFGLWAMEMGAPPDSANQLIGAFTLFAGWLFLQPEIQSAYEKVDEVVNRG